MEFEFKNFFKNIDERIIYIWNKSWSIKSKTFGGKWLDCNIKQRFK